MKKTLSVVILFFFGRSFAQTVFEVKNLQLLPQENVQAKLHQKIAGKTDATGKVLLTGILKGDTVFFQAAGLSAQYIAAEINPKTTQMITLEYLPAENFDEIREVEKQPAEQPASNKIFDLDGPEPTIIGGVKALKEYFAKTMVYPPSAIRDSIEGKCYLQILVSKTGEVLEAKVTQGIPNCPECDTEAVRVAMGITFLQPGKIDGENVASCMDLPLNFKLEKEFYPGIDAVPEPTFIGGSKALKKHFASNVTYPPSAVKDKLEGKCYLRILVDQTGRVTKVILVGGVPDCPQCDEEAIRVARTLPRFQPAKVGEQKMDSYLEFPVEFKLH